MLNSIVVPPEFEGQREIHETSNERLIADVMGVVYLVGFLFHLSTHLGLHSILLSPWPVVGLLALGTLLCFLLHVYLAGNPPYRPYRKYAIILLEGLMVGAIISQLQSTVPMDVVITVGWAVCLLIPVSSMLRYSIPALYFSAVTAEVVFAATIAPSIAMPYRIAALAGTTVVNVAMATLLGYSSEGLTRIHQASIQKERLKRFLDPKLVEQVAADPGLLEQQTQHRTATVLFTDIRNFTTLSERLTPDEVVAFLNTFLEEMTTSVMEHGGMLDKYIGDCVMAVFGVPLTTTDHALKAVQCSLDMLVRLDRLNLTLQDRGLPQLGIGTGIHTGDLLVGAIGSKQRLDYTVIGDTVNVASRLEGMTRKYPYNVILSDVTREALAGAIDVVAVDTVSVKGRATVIPIWAPVASAEKAVA